MTKDFTVRQYQPGDEEGIVQLLKLVFDGWPHFDLNCTPMDHWRWKYLDNPLKKIFSALIVSDQKIIGCSHSLPVRIKIGENILLCVVGADVAVHPDFRKSGMSKKIRYLKREIKNKLGIQLSYSVTINPILIKSFMKNRPPFPHAILNFVRIMDIDKQLQAMPIKNAWLIKLGFHGSKILNDLRNLIVSPAYRNRDIQVRRIEAFDDRIDLFWEQISGHYNFIVERKQDYLNWRYNDPRAGDFIVMQVEEDEQILGYSVLKINRFQSTYPIGFIVDLLTLPNRPDVASALVEDAVNYFDNININIVSCTVSKNHPHVDILKKYGFLDSRIKVPVFFRLTNKQMYKPIVNRIKVSSADKVHFSYGDLDSLPMGIPSYIRKR